MKLLTPTPDLQAYLVAVVAVASLAPGSVASQVRMLWPGPRAPSFLPVYLATMACVGVLGLTVLDLPIVRQSSPVALALSLFVGLPAGLVAFSCDESIRRAFKRRAFDRPADAVAWSPMLPGSRRTHRLGRAESSAGAALDMRDDDVPTLVLLLAIAVLEELLFRGFLVEFALRLSPPGLAALAIAGTVLAFAAGHVFWGPVEALAKAPLGIAALAASLPFHCLLGAVAAHVVFNARSWHMARTAVGPRRAAV